MYIYIYHHISVYHDMSISFYIWAIDSLNMFFRDLEWTQLRAMPPWAAPSDLPWRGLRELNGRLISRNGISILLGTSGQNLGFHANGKCPISQVVQNVMKLPDASGKKKHLHHPWKKSGGRGWNLPSPANRCPLEPYAETQLRDCSAGRKNAARYRKFRHPVVPFGSQREHTIPKTSFASLWTCKCPVMTLMKSDIWPRGIPKNNHN